ncbi:MAG: AEC family transporter [Gymnodinialimonas sp.]
MLMQMVNVLAPVAIITLIGYLMGRSKVGLETRSLSTLVIMVATPSLIFHTLTSLHVAPATIQVMSGAALFCMAVAGVMALVLLLGLGKSVRSFLPPLMLPNSGNLGLPLVLLAFGPEGLQLGIAYFFVVSLVQHTFGLSVYSGSLKLGLLARQPLIYAVAAVIVVTWTGIQVPPVIATTAEMLGGMMIPAMLILLGASLATLGVSDMGPAVLIAVSRLVIGVASALFVIWVLDFSGVMAGVVFLLASMPTAIVNYVLAERYNHNPRQVAGAIVASTVLTFACLPAMLWVALQIAQVP